MVSKKVFIGLQDIASFFDDWSVGFIDNGFEVSKGSILKQHKFTNSKLDFVLEDKLNLIGYFKQRLISSRLKPFWDKKVREYYLNKALKECEVFLFIWDSFYQDYSDYKIIKNHGKKIITVFVGDDVRWEEAMKQEFLSHNLHPWTYKQSFITNKALNQRLTYLRNAEKYSDVILSQPNISQLALRPYKNLFIPINIKEYSLSSDQRIMPKLVHAPTSVGKGTVYVEDAISKLKDDGLQFEYIRIENKPRAEALKIYSDSDVIIDQLLLPGGGKLAHEGLALGKVVLTCMGYDNYNQGKPSECPLVDVRIETLYSILKELIPNQAKRQEIADKGRPYVLKYHNPKTIVREVLNEMENKVLGPDHIIPKFFREKFIPESDEKISIYNQWTEFVSTTNWYKQSVLKGERDGLKFS